ncbi:NTP transferase domain-containing protein [Heliorestis acidaminivorans]|uniref:NTP transferase domain-containing protein n=1 Tax=Heliorestis acidaminivorans TaxID=553427 RepID=A0A6I0EZV5_9FIRM|nr:NTP transferase domain-containing protein [Heliorestis acidaminivorans]KAB2953025.1 NTP transferase domain-containing protein [Heliorestis acidaminivorans]
MDAIILAASPNDSSLKKSHSASKEALIPIGSRPMVDYVVQALLESSKITRIVLVGPTEVEGLYKNNVLVQVIEGGTDHLDSLQKGLSKLANPSEKILVVAGDIPLLTAPALERFLLSCSDQEADLYYPLIRREDSELKYPGIKRTFVKLQDGEVTGGNILLFRRAILDRLVWKGREFIKLRKDPLGLAGLLGWRFLFSFIRGSLRIEEAQVRVSDLLGIRGLAIIADDPEIGFDVDKPEDLALVRAVLSRQQNRGDK